MEIDTAALLAIAVLNAFTAWMAYRTRGKMKTLEHNTNSIMEKLVASTAKASRAQGHREGLETHERLKRTPRR